MPDQITDSADNRPSSRPAAGRNRRLAIVVGLVAGGMVGLAYAAVPLYDTFCRVTGLGGTTQVADSAPGQVLDRTMTVRFDANTAPDLPWRFKPVQIARTGAIGETQLAFYEATNTGSEPITGTATYNVTPAKAGLYFNKIDCFCFVEQTLEPGQTLRMPVSYFIDPAIVDDDLVEEVTEVTLSYTFFPVGEPKRGESKKTGP